MAAIPPSHSAADIIRSAFKLIGVLGESEAGSAAMINDGLSRLNDLVDAWGAERLTIYTTDRNVYTLTSGQQTYTIGPGADFNQARPMWIPYAGFISQVTQPYPLETPLSIWTIQQWAGIPTKTGIFTTIPEGIYYDGGFPLGKISFWPIFQTGGAGQVALYTPTALTGFNDLVTQHTFPPAYMRALRYNLAVELAPEFGRPIMPEVTKMAGDFLQKLKHENWTPDLLVCDGGVCQDDGGSWSTYNIYNDTMGRGN